MTDADKMLSASLFEQRIFLRDAIWAAREVLPPNLAKVVAAEFESVINLGDTFGVFPLQLRAGAELIDLREVKNAVNTS